MNLSDKQKLFASMVPRLIDHAFDRGYAVTLGDAFRDERVEYGHANSMHRKRLAIDLNLFSPDGEYLTDSESYRWLGEYWESLHPANKWGGENDGNHFSSFAWDYGMVF